MDRRQGGIDVPAGREIDARRRLRGSESRPPPPPPPPRRAAVVAAVITPG